MGCCSGKAAVNNNEHGSRSSKMGSLEEEIRAQRHNGGSYVRDPGTKIEEGKRVAKERVANSTDTLSTCAPSSGVRESSESPPLRENASDTESVAGDERAVLTTRMEAARSNREELEALTSLAEDGVDVLLRVCEPPASAQSSSLRFLPMLLMNSGGGGVSDATKSGGNEGDVAAAAAAAAASAAASAEAPPPSRTLRVVAESLAAELVMASTLAEACSPRGVLRGLAVSLAMAATEAGSGPGAIAGTGTGMGAAGNVAFISYAGAGLEEERETEILAATERIRQLLDRLESVGDPGEGKWECSSRESGDLRTSRGKRSGKSPRGVGTCAEDGSTPSQKWKSREGGSSNGSAVTATSKSRRRRGHPGESSPPDAGSGPSRLSSSRTGADGDSSSVELFRREFIKRTREAGGLKALALSWSGVALLEEAFMAWVGKSSPNSGDAASYPPLDLKTEILRLASFVAAVLPLSPIPTGVGHGTGAAPAAGMRSVVDATKTSGRPPQHPSPSSAAGASGSRPLSSGPLNSPHEPPAGAPLRPRHYVSRDRLAGAAAASLLRGVGIGGDKGGRGGGAADGKFRASGGQESRGSVVVVLSGRSGAGKSCLAAEVIARRDVRAKFADAILWLQVGRGVSSDLPLFLRRLAHAYHKVVLSKRLRNPPQMPQTERFRGSKKSATAGPSEIAGTAYLGDEEAGRDGSAAAARAAAAAAAATAAAAVIAAETEASAKAAQAWFKPFLSSLGLRCLVVLEDVWETEVVGAAAAVGFDVLVTTPIKELVPDTAPCTLIDVGGLTKEEARSLLRRCSGLDAQTALPPSADGIIQACGALALSLAMAGSLPAVRCRSDEAAWSNLHSILSHKATRLGEPRTTWRAGSGSGSSTNGGSGAAAPGGPGVGALAAAVNPGGALGSWEGRCSGGSTGATGGGGGGGGAAGAGVSPSGSGSGAGGFNSRKGSKENDPPPWVAAVLWASLHALPKGHADQYLALAALPSYLRGAPAVTPSAAGVRGAAGGMCAVHLAALWGVPGIGGGNRNGGTGGADVEEAEATIEMLVSRALLQRRAAVSRPSLNLANLATLASNRSGGGGGGGDGGGPRTPSLRTDPRMPGAQAGDSSAASTAAISSDDSGQHSRATAGAAAAAAVNGRRTSGREEEQVTGEERYTMHPLQAAYVRSTARNRADLLKTLNARREAALAVIGPDALAEAEAAAAATGAGTGSGGGGESGRGFRRDGSLPDRCIPSTGSSPISNAGGSGAQGYNDAYSSAGSAAFGALVNGASPLGAAASPSNTHLSGGSGIGRRRSPASAAAAAASASPYGSGGGSGPGSGSDASGTAYGEDDLIRGTRNNESVVNGGNIILSGRGKSSNVAPFARVSGDRHGSGDAIAGSALASNGRETEVTTGGSANGDEGNTSGTRNPVENQVKWSWPGTAVASSRGADGIRGGGSSAMAAGRGAAVRAVTSRPLPPFTPGSGGDSGSDLHGKAGGRGSDNDSNGVLGIVGDRLSGVSDRDRAALVAANGSGGGGMPIARRTTRDSTSVDSDRRQVAGEGSSVPAREDPPSLNDIPKGAKGGIVASQRGGSKRSGFADSVTEFSIVRGITVLGNNVVSPSNVRKRAASVAPRSPSTRITGTEATSGLGSNDSVVIRVSGGSDELVLVSGSVSPGARGRDGSSVSVGDGAGGGGGGGEGAIVLSADDGSSPGVSSSGWEGKGEMGSEERHRRRRRRKALKDAGRNGRGGGVERGVAEGKDGVGGPGGGGSKEEEGERQKHKVALEDALDSTVLGDLWFERGELREARHEHMRALRIRTELLPPGHPDVAESLESLGNVAIREGRHVEAERLHRQALEMRVQALGAKHMDVAATLNNLAVSLKAQPGKLGEAESVCSHALSIVEANSDAVEETPHLMAALLKLKSKILKRQGRRAEAAGLRARAMAVVQRADAVGSGAVANGNGAPPKVTSSA